MANENETVEQLCQALQNQSLYNDSLEDDAWAFITDMGSKILAAHKREIASLMGDIAKLLKNGDLLCVQKVEMEREIEKRNALIKELADALKKIDDMCDGDMCKFFTDNEHCSKCKYVDECSTGVAHNVLITHESEIAKAREVAK